MPRITGPQTRERLARAAIRLFAKQGFAATTTRDIASAARVAEGSIYRHFASKEAIAASLFATHYLAIADALKAAAARQSGAAARIDAMIRQACAAFDQDRELFAFLFLAEHLPMPDLPAERSTPYRLLHDAIVEGQKARQFRTGDPQLLALMVFGMILRPARAALQGYLDGKLASRAGDIAAAARRVLAV
jgi:AcrR family transcriptional regulator